VGSPERDGSVEVGGAARVRPLNTGGHKSVGSQRGRRCGSRRRETHSPVVFDDFIGLKPVAFQRGIGATRPAGGVCRSVGRTCNYHARSSRVRRDGRGWRALPSLPLPPRVMDRGR